MYKQPFTKHASEARYDSSLRCNFANKVFENIDIKLPVRWHLSSILIRVPAKNQDGKSNAKFIYRFQTKPKRMKKLSTSKFTKCMNQCVGLLKQCLNSIYGEQVAQNKWSTS